MSRRIEVELTSERGDGTWTWRAAGAKQPKGVLDGSLLYDDARVGDVVRAEADFDIDGITVTHIYPPKHARAEPDRIEVIGPPREFKPVIANVSAAAARGEDRRPRGRDGDRRPRPGGPGDRDRRGRPDRPDRPDRPGGGARPEGAGRPSRPDRPRRERPAPPEPKPKPKRLKPGRVHRDAAMQALPPEQQAVAEQVLRGGIPAVRTALDEQNVAAKAAGQPEINPEGLLALAEDLLPRLRVADWLDRADAAIADVDEISLRDLRSVVVSADDVARDESTRDLAARLKEALETRVEKAQAEWLADITSSLDGGRVVRALRLSARPPEPSFKFPPELQTRLTEMAGAALAPDIAPDRWGAVLDAVAYSPVRREVTPAGVPENVTDELKGLAQKHVGRVPSIAPLFGIEVPAAPPGRPAKGRRGADRPRPPKQAPAHVGRPPRPPGAPPPPPPGFVPGAAATAAPASPTTDETTPVSTAPAPDAATAPPAGDGGADRATSVSEAAPADAAPADAAPAETPVPTEPAAAEPEAAPSVAAEPPAAPEPAAAEPEAAPPVAAEPPAAPAPDATPEAPSTGAEGAPLGVSPASDAASVPPPAPDVPAPATEAAVPVDPETAPLGVSPAPDAAAVPPPADAQADEAPADDDRSADEPSRDNSSA